MIEAVTLDAFGTLVTLRDPVPALGAALRERGLERPPEEIGAAFRTEVAYYQEHAHEGRDAASLAALRRDCAAVFLDAAAAGLDPAEFAAPFVGALEFEPLPGVPEALAELRARGLRLAVVSNWDVSLEERLAEAGVDGFDAVVSAADAGSLKPDPAVFRLALERLGVAPERALHVGDSDEDERGARGAGMRFAPAPLPDAVRALA